MHLEPTEAWYILRICAALIAVFLLAVHLIKLKAKVPLFYCWLGAIAVLGGAAAFFLPIAVNSGFAKDDDGSALRQAILYTTGGLLGVITLGETHRKNNQEKEKNENDHIRQVHAERRSRYTAAVEQLANEKAAVRLGGIYTLAGLVDEWLADTTLEPKEQQKEGQVIINNLCSYIRSSFTLALKAEMLEGDSEPDNYEGDFSKDQAAFHEEQDVRRTIFDEMSKRSSSFIKDKEDKTVVIPGAWSNFNIDFSRASIFYPLSNLTIEKGNFSSAKFYSNADFSEATFTQTANFSKATFTQTANFSKATFTQTANFSKATFTQTARFSWATFAHNADFNCAAFTQTADFSCAAFTQTADFSRAAFTQTADFNWATFAQTADFSRAAFTQTADFRWATFAQNADFSWATFTHTADFSWATFTQNANFRGAAFTQNANFRGAAFTQNADFSWATFAHNADFSCAAFTQNADFHGASFTQNTNFSRATFSASSPKFVETSEVSEQTFRARFATLPKNQRAYSFTVSKGSFPILLGEAELNGVKYRIPVGTVLFDPSSEKTSEPAKSLDKSNDSKEEKPAE